MAEILSGKSPFKEEMEYFLQDSGIKESTAEILGPFSDITNQISSAVWEAIFPSATTNSLYWPLLVLTLLISAAFWVFRGQRGAKDVYGREKPMSFLEYLLPKKIYTHQSARVDIWLYLLDRGLMPIWVIVFLGSAAPFFERSTISSMQFIFGNTPALEQTITWKTHLWVSYYFDCGCYFFLYTFNDASYKDRMGHS